MLHRLDAFIQGQRESIIDLHSYVAAGRLIIALAQISVLLFTPTEALFVPVGGVEAVESCTRFANTASPYCWFPDSRSLVSWFLIAGLVWVASGFLPQVSSFLHIWISFSLAQSISLPDGGDYVAQVVTVFVAFITLGHGRLWLWRRSPQTGKPSIRISIAVGFMWVLRVQMAWIYLNSALSKVSVPEWQEGSALYYVVRMEMFGASEPLVGVLLWLTSVPFITAIASWGTILTECTIAVLILSPGRKAAVAFLISALLHVAIIAVIGLFSFALIMIGSMLIASSAGLHSTWKQYTINRKLDPSGATSDALVEVER